MVLKVEYQGNSIMFAGDSDYEGWKDRIVPHYSGDKSGTNNLLKSTFLHASHHCSHTFFTENSDDEKDKYYTRHLEEISPIVTIISVGESNQHGLPHPTSLSFYEKYTFSYKKTPPSGQVFQTKDQGTMIGVLYDNGQFEIMPLKMVFLLEKSNHRLGTTAGEFIIKAFPLPGEDGYYSKGVNLKFNIKWIKKVSEKVPCIIR